MDDLVNIGSNVPGPIYNPSKRYLSTFKW